MPRELRVIQGPDGHRIVDAAGHVLATTPGRQAALERAIHELHTTDGGTVTVVDRTGTAGQPIPVDGVRATVTPPAAPAAAPPVPPVPPQARVVAEPKRTWEPERVGRRPAVIEQPSGPEEGAKKVAEKAAEIADELLDRKEQPGPLPDALSGITIEAEKGSELARVNTHVSFAAAWIAYVSFVLGTGTLSSVVSAMINASEGSATVGAYQSTAMVFFTSAALCASVAWAVWAVLQGKAQGWGAVAAWVIGTTILAEFLHALGLAGPTGTDVLTAISTYPGSPPGWVGGVFQAFVNAYGLTAVVTGIGVGAIAGFYVHGRTPRT